MSLPQKLTGSLCEHGAKGEGPVTVLIQGSEPTRVINHNIVSELTSL